VTHPSDLTAALQASGSAVLNVMRRGQARTLALSPAPPPAQGKDAPAKGQKGKK
jgi:hypothetical protein